MNIVLDATRVKRTRVKFFGKTVTGGFLTTGGTQKTTHQVFDAYWRRQEYTSADARSHQRAAFAAAMLKQAEGRLLDVGCGRGLVAAYFAGLGYDVLGTDVSPLSVSWTQARGITARKLDLERDALGETYEIIVCLETLQYLRDPVAALDKLTSALARGGELIVSLPCEYHILRRLSILLFGKGPGGIDHPLTVFTAEEHRRLFDRVGLAITGVRPVSLVPPRWRLLAAVGQLFARLAPSLFALSIIYRLVPRR